MKNEKMEYLSDEELMKLIQDTENQEMLVAPSYLKSEILTRISESDNMKIRNTDLENASLEIALERQEIVLPMESSKEAQSEKIQNKKRTLMIYRFKVAVVATAAIFALFLMPVGDSRSEMPQNEERNQASVTRTINERTNSFCNSLFELSNGIISPRDNRK